MALNAWLYNQVKLIIFKLYIILLYLLITNLSNGKQHWVLFSSNPQPHPSERNLSSNCSSLRPFRELSRRMMFSFVLVSIAAAGSVVSRLIGKQFVLAVETVAIGVKNACD